MFSMISFNVPLASNTMTPRKRALKRQVNKQIHRVRRLKQSIDKSKYGKTCFRAKVFEF